MRNMVMLDANAVLRYVLNDNEKDVLKLGLETYAENNLDFVDCILYAYKSLKNYDVLTFDKKLKRLLDNV